MSLTAFLWVYLVCQTIMVCAWATRRPGSRVTTWTQSELTSVVMFRTALLLWGLAELIGRYL